MAIAQQLPVVAQHAADGQRTHVRRIQRLAHQEMHRRQRQHAECRQHREDRPPRRHLQHRPADHRRKDGRHAHHQHQRGIGLRRAGRIHPVAHGGTRDHHARAAAEALHGAQHGQRPGVGGERAADRRGHVQCQADVERGLAAEAVAGRAVDQLADRQADQEGRERDPRRGRRRLEVARDGRQARQVHVDRQRADGGQRAQQQKPAGDGTAQAGQTDASGIGSSHGGARARQRSHLETGRNRAGINTAL